MIYDTLEHAELYVATHRLLEEALRFLTTDDLPRLEAGRHEVAGGAYASVQAYTTSPFEQGSFESHRRYVDVQYLIAGEEWIYVAAPDALHTTQGYDQQSDCTLYRGTPETRVLMRPGCFLLLFPHDAHMPCVTVERPAAVKKVVVKLPIERSGA